MKNLIKYGCYTLLAVAVFTAFWLIGGFISIEYDMNKWNKGSRFFLIIMWIAITGCVIGYNEER